MHAVKLTRNPPFPPHPPPGPTSWQVSKVFLNSTQSPKISLIFFFKLKFLQSLSHTAAPGQSILIQLSSHPPLSQPHMCGSPETETPTWKVRKEGRMAKLFLIFKSLSLRRLRPREGNRAAPRSAINRWQTWGWNPGGQIPSPFSPVEALSPVPGTAAGRTQAFLSRK